MKFTIANGKVATLIRTIIYKDFVIEKVSRQGVEFYTVASTNHFWKLKEAKAYVDYIKGE